MAFNSASAMPTLSLGTSTQSLFPQQQQQQQQQSFQSFSFPSPSPSPSSTLTAPKSTFATTTANLTTSSFPITTNTAIATHANWSTAQFSQSIDPHNTVADVNAIHERLRKDEQQISFAIDTELDALAKAIDATEAEQRILAMRERTIMSLQETYDKEAKAEFEKVQSLTQEIRNAEYMIATMKRALSQSTAPKDLPSKYFVDLLKVYEKRITGDTQAMDSLVDVVFDDHSTPSAEALELALTNLERAVVAVSHHVNLNLECLRVRHGDIERFASRQTMTDLEKKCQDAREAVDRAIRQEKLQPQTSVASSLPQTNLLGSSFASSFAPSGGFSLTPNTQTALPPSSFGFPSSQYGQQTRTSKTRRS